MRSHHGSTYTCHTHMDGYAYPCMQREKDSSCIMCIYIFTRVYIRVLLEDSRRGVQRVDACRQARNLSDFCLELFSLQDYYARSSEGDSFIVGHQLW